jgi:hypothetical protein
MRRKLLIVALLLAAGAMLGVYTSTTKIIWDGGYELTIHVSSNPGPPRSVNCLVCGNREEAEFVLMTFLPETRWSATADPFASKPLMVNVPVSGKASWSGRELSWVQFPWLVVIAVLPDGRRVAKLIKIPDGRVSREVAVELP